MRIAIFGLFATVVWSGAHVYLGRRLIGGTTLAGRHRWLAWAALGLSAVLPPLAMILGRAVESAAWVRALIMAGYVAMGLGSLVFVFVVVSDLLRGATSVGRRFLAGTPGDHEIVDPARRRFFGNVVNAGMVGTAGTLAAVGYTRATAVPDVVEVDVPIDDLPPALHGFRIVQLSDVHIGPTIRGDFLELVVDRVNELGADMVAVTGDLVDGYVHDLAPEVAPLQRLRARHGSFFVTGNHEYYWDGLAWCGEVGRLGLTVLDNRHRVIEHDGARVLLAGVNDYKAGDLLPEHASSPSRAREGAPACDVDILLAHQPRSVFEAAKAGYHLQISGHTHGGQYFPMNLLVHLAQPYVAGLQRHAERMWIYVSRGTGYWGPPNRLGSPHEITLLRLVRA